MNKRKKYSLGAAIIASSVIGAGSGILGSIFNSSSRKRELRRQQILENRQNTLDLASALSDMENDTQNADEFENKLVFKTGGKTKDRVAIAKRFACGGRKRKAFGSNIDNNNSNFIASTNNIPNIKNDFTTARMGTNFKRKCSK